MPSAKMEAALNEQLNAELYSAYMYLAMCAYFEDVNLLGFANWMRMQAQEELAHGLKFYDYIHDRDGRVVLTAIDTPPKDWDNPLAAFRAAYEHEEEITQRINRLSDQAIAEGDHATQIFLQWFVTEQVEELASTKAVIDKLELVKDSPSGLFLVDHELSQRAPESEEGEAE